MWYFSSMYGGMNCCVVLQFHVGRGINCYVVLQFHVWGYELLCGASVPCREGHKLLCGASVPCREGHKLLCGTSVLCMGV